MILQALKGYYDRKAADPASGIAPDGWEVKEISFVVVLNEKGSLLQIEDTREGEGIKKRGRAFLVPQGVKKTSGVAANLLWDVAGYVFGILDVEGLKEEDKKRKLSRLPDQKKAFIERIQNELPNTPRKKALLAFLSAVERAELEKIPQWEDIYRTNPNISFRFDGEYELYCETEEIKNALAGKDSSKKYDSICLITGEKDQISTLHTSIKGVWGAQSSGANIVSFNKDAFRSFGKEQGKNAPVGEAAMFAYTTALNTLLSRDSRQRIQIGDASTVFWSANKTQFEEDFAYIFSEPAKDDPDAGTERVKNLIDSLWTGTYIEDAGKEKFYILGLAPNAARISIRFWRQGTVGEFADHIRQHFEDLKIVKPKNEPEYYSLWRLLVNTAVQDKSENIPPNIAGDFMCSIIDGTPYPATLLQAVLRRIRSDTENRVKPVRAALIKAYLNRYYKKEEIKVALDTEQSSIGYQLGRLFAVLEKIQEEANPGLNATIRERYYGAACGAPVTVFPTLLRLKNHHIAKLENKGRGVNLEKIISEIMGHYNDFPSHLNLHEQGKFAIGYYHQRQDFFTAKNEERN
ncbi:type I-C CRISPR-associated protein Cas8c/Csd1 [Spirochaetia bacterium]|nr:type I-C CRISPR-associated protein Cas8c/Csd1 [Spirochaetia bacterium]